MIKTYGLIFLGFLLICPGLSAMEEYKVGDGFMADKISDYKLVQLILQDGRLDSPEKILYVLEKLIKLQDAVEYAKLNLSNLGKILKHLKINFELRDQNGHTALHLAIMQKKLECAEILIEAGADVNAECLYGNTPLRMSVYRGYTDCVKQLLLANANIDEPKSIFFPISYLAVLFKHSACLKLLLDAGVKVEEVGVAGEYALGLACRQKDTKCARILVDYYVKNNLPIPVELFPVLKDLRLL